MGEKQELIHAIETLENQREQLGDSVVNAALAPMRARLAELQTRSSGEQRKLVTILFADLVGSTAMTENMDPEDMREILKAYFDLWSRHLKEHGGVIEKFIGDAVMAVFGLTFAREDDPEQALRSALEMRKSLAALNERLERSHNLRLDTRVGVHSGQVLVSTLEEERQGQDFVVVGEAVNLASRLQSSAPPGGVIISESTYKLVRGVFDLQAMEPIRVKGIREPIQTYLVIQEKPRAFRMGVRGLEGIETHMVGREEELSQLQKALYRAIESGNQQVVGLMGEAGVGKSRLIYEFDLWLDLIPERVRYLKGRASPSTTNLPYALMRDMLAFRFEIQDSDPPEVLREKLESSVQVAIGDRPDWRRRAHFIGQLVGFEIGTSALLEDAYQDARSFHDQALACLNDYFQGLADQRPVVILLEDLHWADESSLDLIEYLGKGLHQRPILIVCSARPELFERRPDWNSPLSLWSRIDLQRLSMANSRQLVGEILQKVDKIPYQLEEKIVADSEGNPFYIEELVKMLIEVGVIASGEETWSVDISRLSAAGLPSTLVGVLQARVDRLNPEGRECLQRAAVIGRNFWDATVAYLGKDKPGKAIRALGQVLDDLCRRELVFREEVSAFSGASEYLFKHTLLRDVTYETLLKAHRRRYHARAARWLEANVRGTGRASEYASRIAEHHDLAGENDPAARWYHLAGERAAAKYANQEAIRFFSRALELTPESEHAARFDLIAEREKTFDLLGIREKQGRDLQMLETLAERLGAKSRAEVAYRRASFALNIGQFAQTRETVRFALDLIAAEPKPDEGLKHLEVDLHITGGKAAQNLGEIDTTERELELALRLARRHRYVLGEIKALDNLGNLYYSRGEHAKADEHHKKALPLAQAIGNRRLELSILNHLGIIAKERGNYHGAIDYYTQTLSIARAVSSRHGQSLALSNLGEVEQLQGDFVQAFNYTQAGLEVSREIGDRKGVGIGLANLAEIHATLGNFSRAKELVGQALKIMQGIGFRMGEGIVLGNQGQIALMEGDYTLAEELGKQALEIATEVDDRIGQGIVLGILAGAMDGLGEHSAAEDTFTQALAVWEEINQDSGRFRALAGLSRLALKDGQTADLRRALDRLEPIISDIEKGGVAEAEMLFEVILTCWQMLEANRDPRAGKILERAYELLKVRAARISDPELRRSYLENNPVNRQLMEARLET